MAAIQPGREALKEFREFIALLLVGAPALYSFEALFTALNEALKVQPYVNWRASAWLCLIFLTLNIRFINGNYEHLKSPQWKNTKLGSTSIPYVFDLCSAFLMHALLVVMASRCFVLDDGLPVGVKKEDTGAFYCPGFFATVLALLFVDICWAAIKSLVFRFLLGAQKLQKFGSSHHYPTLFSYPFKLFRWLSGAYALKIETWLVMNVISVLILIACVSFRMNSAGLEPFHWDTAKAALVDLNYFAKRDIGVLKIIGCLSIVACAVDLGTTALGQAGDRMISRVQQYREFMQFCAMRADEIQSLYGQAPTYLGELPFGWRVIYNGGHIDLLASGSVGSPGSPGDLTESSAAAFQRWSLNEGIDPIKCSNSIVIVCTIKPKQADLGIITSSLVTHSGKRRRRTSKPHVTIVYYIEDLLSHRTVKLEADASMKLFEVDPEHIYLAEDVAEPTRNDMAKISACMSDLGLSHVLAEA